MFLQREAPGYTRQDALEVVFAVAMKTLSNYANHMAETLVDTQFQPQAWEQHALPVRSGGGQTDKHSAF